MTVHFIPKLLIFYLTQKFDNINRIGSTSIFKAPEVISAEEKLDEKIDIHQEVMQGLRPEFSVPVKESIKELIKKCWSGDPDERSSSEELYKKLTFDKNFYLDDVDVDVLQQYIDEI